MAEGSPDDIRKHAPPREDGAPASLEDAFLAITEEHMKKRRRRNMTASLKRIGALIVKELHQVVRDPGNVGIAVILPAVLLLLFGYGMSMDIKNVRIAYLAVPASSHSTDLETRLTLSRYFQTTRVFSTREAEEKLRTHEADAFIALQSNAPDTLHNGITKVQIVVNGVNANQATLIRNYLQAVVGSWASSLGGRTAPVLDVQTRTRFNEANDSHYYLVPGVIVTIMTMIGALLTSLVMAREYERGTLESLFVTPVGSGEILTAKAATNFLLGMVSLAISMIFAAFVFGIPIRGSLTLLLAVSALFLIVALGLGLVISTAAKNQFLACQFAIMGTFMPALMLSGFLYDILNMPPRRPGHHLHHPGPLLRHPAPDPLPGRGYPLRHHPLLHHAGRLCRGAHGHRPAESPQIPRITPWTFSSE